MLLRPILVNVTTDTLTFLHAGSWVSGPLSVARSLPQPTTLELILKAWAVHQAERLLRGGDA